MSGYPTSTSTRILLQVKSLIRIYFKAKSDFFRDLIPEIAIQKLWRRVKGESGTIIFTPYGGMMNRISESAIPFPHMASNTLYNTSPHGKTEVKLPTSTGQVVYTCSWSPMFPSTQEDHMTVLEFLIWG